MKNHDKDNLKSWKILTLCDYLVCPFHRSLNEYFIHRHCTIVNKRHFSLLVCWLAAKSCNIFSVQCILNPLQFLETFDRLMYEETYLCGGTGTFAISCYSFSKIPEYPLFTITAQNYLF